MFTEIVNKWYNDGPINARVRELLMENVFNAVRINGFDLYRTSDGTPSGFPLTAVFNSAVNHLMTHTVMVCDLKITNFDIAVYGDDNLIHSDRTDLSCADLAPHLMRRFGMTYTHFSKDGALNTVNSILEVRYLGREFVPQDTFIRAPLRLEIIVESSYWINSQIEQKMFMINIAESLLLELSHHPEKFYD
jgi:hypothetical protein